MSFDYPAPSDNLIRARCMYRSAGHDCREGSTWAVFVRADSAHRSDFWEWLPLSNLVEGVHASGTGPSVPGGAVSPRGADLRQAVLATRAASPRVVLAVGELNPYGSRPEYALWHEPRGAAGDRLRRIMGLTDEQYLATVARMNLCDGPKWSTPWARERFWDGVDFGAHALVVLLGARVRDAAMGPPFFQVAGGVGPCVFLSLPHPSGRCRAWNDKTQVDRARAALRASAPGIPWGCAGDAL